MAGNFGSDFDPTKPEDTGQVKQGASWIRDIRQRLKRAVGVVMSPETGLFKQSVVPSEALANVSGAEPGTWREFVVDRYGRVRIGRNPSQLVSVPTVYRGSFLNAGAVYDLPTTTTAVTIGTPVATVYTGGTDFSKVYESNSTVAYREYQLTVPDDCHKLLAKLTGGGGGGYINGGASRADGAAGEYREATMAVTPGALLTIRVGLGGGPSATAPDSGCTSMIRSGAVFIEAAGGGSASASTGGAPQVGAVSSNGLGYCYVSPSRTGLTESSPTTQHDAGNPWWITSSNQHGRGGNGGTVGSGTSFGGDGLVIIEYLV